MERILSGPPGLSVMSRVVMELNYAAAPAPIRLQTEQHRAADLLMRRGHATSQCAQHQVNIFQQLTDIFR